MRGKDQSNLPRMFAALCLLLIFPLLSIAVGAVCWGSLERGLLVFNLLGLAGFALATRLKPVYQGPEEPVPGLPRWGHLLLGLLLGLVLLLLLTSCHSPAEVTPSPSPSPDPTSSAVETTPEPELRKLPAILCDNGQWSVYMDSWEWTGENHQNSVMELSFHDRAGVCRQTLQTFSGSIGPQQPGFAGPQSGSFATLTDLNFDGIEDLRLSDFQSYYKAFLWDRNIQQFVEEPTFSSIPRPYPMDGLIFGCGSSGASGTDYSAWSYSPETGYHLVRSLWIDIIDFSGKEGQAIYTERYYEDGIPTDIIETEEDLSQSDFWRDYVEYCDKYVWG